MSASLSLSFSLSLSLLVVGVDGVGGGVKGVAPFGPFCEVCFPFLFQFEREGFFFGHNLGFYSSQFRDSFFDFYVQKRTLCVAIRSICSYK